MPWLRVHVELRDASPVIWRELLVPHDLPLPELHCVLQVAMGWQDSHLHSFARGGGSHWEARSHWVMDDPDNRLECDETDIPESEATVGTLLPTAGAQATYLYDFGDDWEHLLTLTGVLDGDSSAVVDLTSPVLTDGGGVCPPEVCGGVSGHAELLEAVVELERGVQPQEWPEQRVRWAFGTLDVEQIRAALTFDLARQQNQVARLGQPRRWRDALPSSPTSDGGPTAMRCRRGTGVTLLRGVSRLADQRPRSDGQLGGIILGSHAEVGSRPPHFPSECRCPR